MSTIRATYVQHGSSPVPNITLDASGNVTVASGLAFNSSLSIPSGSVSAPGLSFVSDTDTGFYSATPNTIAIATSGTAAITVDASQRVGVGTTSLSDAKLEVRDAGDVYLKVVKTGINSTYLGSESSIGVLASDSPLVFRVGTAPSATERARIDSSGRLLVGTSSTSATCTAVFSNRSDGATDPVVRLEINSTSPANGAALGGFNFASSGLSGFQAGARIAAVRDGGTWTNGSSHPTYLEFSTTADGASSPTERMRIGENGMLRVTNDGSYTGVASSAHGFRQTLANQSVLNLVNANASTPYGIQINYTAASPNTTISQFLYCSDSTTLRAEIRSNGGLANYSANNANLSDRNTKKDISPAADTWDCIKEWEIVNYRYKDQPNDSDLNLGVIAQQVAKSCPEVITIFEEAKDNQPEKLGVKEQQMYWMAIKALQEAQVRIEALEASNADLLARLTAAGI